MKFMLRIYEDVKVNGISISMEDQIIISNLAKIIYWEIAADRCTVIMNPYDSLQAIFDDPEFFLETIRQPKDMEVVVNIYDGISVVPSV